MANVFQMVATDKDDPHFNPNLVDGKYHAELSYAGPRTICGIQLDGDDGVEAGPTKRGPITCSGCLSIVKEIKSIRNWRPPKNNR